MAQPIVIPENLAQAVREIKEAAGSGSGDSNFVYINSFIKQDSEVDDGKPHLYIVMDSSVSLTDVSLRYCRKGRVRCRRSGNSPYHENESKQKAHTTGWHEVWRLPIEDRTPLFTPIFKSTTPAFTLRGNAYYEITVGEYATFYDFAMSEFETGYLDNNKDEISISTILLKAGGVCLVKDSKVISNFATFRTQYDDNNDVWYFGKA